ncbi:MAG: hypothetical protein ABGX03_04970 [Methylophilaceae bacterium]
MELLDGELVGGHNQACSDLFNQKRIFLGSIRDPWEWYTSLWAHGCDHKGAIFNSVTKSRPVKLNLLHWRNNPYSAFLTLVLSRSKHPQEWLDTYADVNDVEGFRTWLSMMHSPKYSMDLREGYGANSVSKNAGLLTYRYLKLFCTKSGNLKRLDKLSSFKQIKQYDSEHCFINRFIRNEHLEHDLFLALEDSSVNISDEEKTNILLSEKRNTSSKKHGTRHYYDRQSEKLIAKREKLIIEKFGYLAPSLKSSR